MDVGARNSRRGAVRLLARHGTRVTAHAFLKIDQHSIRHDSLLPLRDLLELDTNALVERRAHMVHAVGSLTGNQPE